MNKTQRGAWIILFSVLLDVVAFVYVGLILLFRSMPPRSVGQAVAAFVAVTGLVFVATAIIALMRPQSRAEPESDERDSMIKRRSILISFLAGWLLVAVVLLILALTLGETGSVPVYVLTVVSYGVFLITLLIYAAATLCQYGRTGKGEQL